MSNFAELLRDEIKNDFDKIEPPKVKTSFETLQILLETQKSFICFGDGEYIIGLGYGYFHIPTKQCRSPWFKYTWVVKNYLIIKKYLIPNKEYGSTDISQIYAGYKDYDFETYYAMLKALFADKKILLICGDKVLANVEYNLFAQAQEMSIIYGATKHAYAVVGAIKEEILKFNKDWLLIFALAPAGKVLGYEMFKLGYCVLDIRHSIKDYDAYKPKVKMDKEGI